MKLSVFNTINMAKAGGKPQFRINCSSGVFSLNKCAVERIGFKAGDKIAFVQDEESPEDWYITRDNDGFAFRSTKECDYLNFNNSKMARTILESLGYDVEEIVSVGFMMKTEPVNIEGRDYWLILTASGIDKLLQKKEGDENEEQEEFFNAEEDTY